jgi:[protein-PII] uridylyltransferase
MQNEIGRLRRKFRDGRAELFRSEARTGPCRELLQNHADLVDSVVEEIYKVSCHAADKERTRTRRSGLAIVATGGYGRRELNPFSDVDIAFIPSEEEDPWVEAAVHMAFRLVMDVFLSFREVRVGYSYRPVSEVSTWDLATKTSLLDARHLCGDRYLSEALELQLRQHLSPLDLALEIQTGSGEGGKTPLASLYCVEPNLKEGPGSLRDLHRGRWIYKLLLGADDSSLLAMLEQKGALPASRIAEIQAAAEWFWQVRNWLHLVTVKRSDVLINNYQDRVASELGGIPTQEWLSRHYAHAETLARFRDSALMRILEGPLDLGGVSLREGYLHLAEKDSSGRPGAVTKLFRLSQRYSIPIGLEESRLLEERRAEAVEVSEPLPQECWEFLNILSETREIARTLRSLCRIGHLDRFIPAFSAVMRFVPPDPAHRYTIGEHSLKIIEHLEDLRGRKDPAGQRFSELLDQCSHFDVLCLAALIHDAGKRLPGENHSETGARISTQVASRLELAPDKRDLLEILVRHHLLLVRTARLQDLKSGGVIQSVAEKVPSIDALRHLYVFTYVDTHAVAEKNWTSMDYRDLEELYQKVQSYLTGRSQDTAAPEAVEERIGQVRRRLVASHKPEEEQAIREHCDAMPASYVLNTPLDEIAFHIQLLRRLVQEKVVLDVYNRPSQDFSELTVCTYDDPQPGMLAKITGVLYGYNADIHKAQVFTLETERHVVLDTLWIRSGGMQLSENRAQRVESALREILMGSRTVDQFLKSVGKNPPSSIPLESVELRNDLSEEHTVVHVVARDLQGLLYLMTRALSRSGLHIHSAKVATWAARAENNFYVTTLTGGQIPLDELPQWQESLTRMFRGMNAG